MQLPTQKNDEHEHSKNINNVSFRKESNIESRIVFLAIGRVPCVKVPDYSVDKLC